MASVFVYHVVGDLTVGKPELAEFHESETVESAIRAIGESPEGSIPIWKKRSHVGLENSEIRQQRFVGILSSFDIVSFLAKSHCLEDQDKALKTPVSEVVVPNNWLLRVVDPATRLIDALDMMKQGVKRLLVPKSVAWKGMSKRFSMIYYGKWLKNNESPSNSSNNLPPNMNWNPSTSAVIRDQYCCLSREDVLRFIIGCLGALAPIPLTSIASLGAINSNYNYIEASTPAIEATQKLPQDPSAVAVIENISDGQCKIIGEISACKLWKCDYLSAAWALANLSAGQFVMGVEDNVTPRSLPEFSVNSSGGGNDSADGGGGSRKPKKFSSRSIGFFSDSASHSFGSRSMYRGRSAPLTCKVTSSLAAVLAQMLSHRATHVWVTEDECEEVLVGVVGYADILAAVTKSPITFIPSNRSTEGFASEIQC